MSYSIETRQAFFLELCEIILPCMNPKPQSYTPEVLEKVREIGALMHKHNVKDDIRDPNGYSVVNYLDRLFKPAEFNILYNALKAYKITVEETYEDDFEAEEESEPGATVSDYNSTHTLQTILEVEEELEDTASVSTASSCVFASQDLARVDARTPPETSPSLDQYPA